jgi:hypothetical protein
MAGVFAVALVPIGVGAFKFYQNYKPEERTEDVHKVRKNTIAHQLTKGGSDSRVSRMRDKQFEKYVRTHSVGKACEAQLRSHREESAVPAQAM